MCEIYYLIRLDDVHNTQLLQKKCACAKKTIELIAIIIYYFRFNHCRHI